MSHIVSIHSFRGGTGKSNTTANLACQLAVQGQRVAVVDTDIQSPGIHVLFGLDESKMGNTLNDFLWGRCAIEEVALNIGEHIEDAPGRNKLKGADLWLVPSSMKSGDISRVLRDGYDVNVLNKGLRDLRKSLNLDFLFIDTHPGLNEETLLSLILSDMLLIILRPDQQDFQGTAVTIDVARSLDVPEMRILVNKALTRYDFDQVRQEVTDIYEVPVVGVLPLTEDLVDLGSADIFSLRYPDHLWSRTIAAIASNILESF